MRARIIVPGQPVGKGRPRVTKSGHAYTPAKTREYEDKIKACYKEQADNAWFDGPVKVTLLAFYKIPKSAAVQDRLDMQSGKKQPMKKPDLDNIIKCIDSLNDLAWKDDSAVVWIEALKFYDEEPRLELTIESV